jgi:hypothetical protein
MPKSKAEKAFPLLLPETTKRTTHKLRFGYFSPEQRVAIKARHDQMRRHEQAKADEILWTVDGKEYNRFGMMDLIIALVAAGGDLVEVCSDKEMPSLAEVRSWYKWHPDFKLAMEEAQTARGEILGEKGLKVLMSLGQDEDGNYCPFGAEEVTLAKAQRDALASHAARINQEFIEKKVFEHRDPVADRSIEELIALSKSMLKNHPALRDIVKDAIVLDVEVADEIEPSTYGIEGPTE